MITVGGKFVLSAPQNSLLSRPNLRRFAFVFETEIPEIYQLPK